MACLKVYEGVIKNNDRRYQINIDILIYYNICSFVAIYNSYKHIYGTLYKVSMTTLHNNYLEHKDVKYMLLIHDKRV